MSHVFISYSRRDSAYARKLADHLLSLGFDVWIDDRIDYGDDWWRAINRAIKACEVVVVVMTPDSDQSRWVQREITLADELAIPTYPLLLAGDLLHSEHWTIFVRTQCVDVRHGELPDVEFFERLGRKVARRASRGIEVTDRPREENLPEVASVLPAPFDWCEISSGPVTLRDATDYGGTSGERTFVDAFYMARFPVTNAQYQIFAEALDGYRNVGWWDFSDEAIAWREAHPHPDFTGFPGGDMPRTRVTWYESMAFCNWLTARLRASAARPLPDDMIVTLPSEQQWQRAAVGDLLYFYPWGMSFDRMLCNTAESKNDQTTPVSRYLGSASPFDVIDLVGNVWEWGRNDWSTGSDNLHTGRERSVRGGSWLDSAEEAQVLNRDGYLANHSLNNLGFRVVLMTSITNE